MKLSGAKERFEIFKAAAEGKIIQWGQHGNWNDLSELNTFFNDNDDLSKYRIKPETYFRPWKPSEVPFGAIVRPMDRHLNWVDTIAYVGGKIIKGAEMCVGLEFALYNYEYSQDGGATWKRCGVQCE